jgi:hypothetical protein
MMPPLECSASGGVVRQGIPGGKVLLTSAQLPELLSVFILGQWQGMS